ncbi:centrosomal protein 20 [Bombyx mori]|uniref:FGFR1 oncogene partner (FOP) N-terminal dimerisation domain-containing protein n=1 Tax=Bombyx mori TaxID=7091 RepID=A0A8R1WFF4_BOMMO|nr:centrosomal protein 20 [Bombyx mori]
MNENKSFSEKEMLIVIKELLKRDGYLNKLSAEVRAKVTEILQERQNSTQKNPPPVPNEEVSLINHLVLEYLEWNGYLYTAAVMASEANTVEKRTRADLCAEVGVKDDEKSSTLPLLSNVVTAYTDRIKRKINKCKKGY